MVQRNNRPAPWVMTARRGLRQAPETALSYPDAVRSDCPEVGF